MFSVNEEAEVRHEGLTDPALESEPDSSPFSGRFAARTPFLAMAAAGS
jgi:hypothetical protein